MMLQIWNSIRNKLNKFKSFLNLGDVLEQIHQLEADEYRHRLLQSDKYKNSKRLNKYEMRVLSQDGEDGIIKEIFHRVGAKTNVFVEIGAGDGSENNTAFLLLQGWGGVWIEGNRKSIKTILRNYKNPISKERLKIIHNYVTAENILTIFEQEKIPQDFDLLSLDVDQNTYWIWAALPEITPRVIVVEYNASIPPSIEWIVEYNGMRSWDGSKYFGASLKSYEILGGNLGYRLVGCNLAGTNAFFVRQDLTANLFDEPLTAENHYEPPRYFLLPRKRDRLQFV